MAVKEQIWIVRVSELFTKICCVIEGGVGGIHGNYVGCGVGEFL